MQGMEKKQEGGRKMILRKNSVHRFFEMLANEVEHGGSAWESNPPVRLFTRHTGFEVREGHQSPFHFQELRGCNQRTVEFNKIP